MMSSDPSETFRQEARDLLESLEQALLDLEQNADDRNLVDSAFRALHTIKGSGAMFGFDEVAAFVHEFETAFDRVRKGTAAASPALIAVALAAKDHLHKLVEQPGIHAAAGEPILAALRKIVEAGGAARAPPPPPPPGGPPRGPPRPPPRRRRSPTGASASACPTTRWLSAPIRCCCSTNCEPLAPAT